MLGSVVEASNSRDRVWAWVPQDLEPRMTVVAMASSILPKPNQTVQSVRRDLLQNMWQETEYHFDWCKAMNGAHVELHGAYKCFEFFIPVAWF
jgi:hypothetical protein